MYTSVYTVCTLFCIQNVYLLFVRDVTGVLHRGVRPISVLNKADIMRQNHHRTTF